MRVALVAGVLLVALFASHPVHADALPPPGDCAQKKGGDACHDFQGRPGTCGTVTFTAINGSARQYFGCRAAVVATPATDAGGSTPDGSGRGKRCSVATPGSPSSAGPGAFIAVALIAAARTARRRR